MLQVRMREELQLASGVRWKEQVVVVVFFVALVLHAE